MIKRIPAVGMVVVNGVGLPALVFLETASVEPRSETTEMDVQRPIEGYLPDSPEREKRPNQTVRPIEVMVSTSSSTSDLSKWTIGRYRGMVYYAPPLKNR